MAGHSKWKQIKHYKAAADKKRGAKFTKLLREITVAAKAGGGDPDGNARLRTAIENAKAQSCPKENIERAVLKGTGELEGVDYAEVLYEAYGPGGVALMIQALTDNPTRTVAEIRAKLSRGGGNLGASRTRSPSCSTARGRSSSGQRARRGRGDGTGARGRRRGLHVEDDQFTDHHRAPRSCTR
jgi:YebC/PmpR family DNA-binding regulatory protein